MKAGYYEGMMKELEEYLDNRYHTVGERIDFYSVTLVISLV